MMGLGGASYGTWKRRQPAGGWTPALLTNLRGWYRADDVTTVGSDVQSLNDKSGVGNHLTAAGAGNRPLLVSTGFNSGAQPYLEFDGAAEWLRHTAFNFGGSPAALTLSIVYQDVTMVAGDRALAYGASPVEIEVRQQAAGPQYVSHFDSFVMAAPMSTPRHTTFTNSGTQIHGYVGSTLTSGPVGSTIVPVDLATLALGATAAGAALASVRVAELVVMRGVISGAELAALASYATARYGV